MMDQPSLARLATYRKTSQLLGVIHHPLLQTLLYLPLCARYSQQSQIVVKGVCIRWWQQEKG
jgi:hypothetical protein